MKGERLPQRGTGASAIDVFLGDWRVTSPLRRRCAIDEYAVEARNATSLVIVEMIQSDVRCNCLAVVSGAWCP